MADASLTVVNNQATLEIFGADLLQPFLDSAASSATAASSSATAAASSASAAAGSASGAAVASLAAATHVFSRTVAPDNGVGSLLVRGVMQRGFGITNRTGAVTALTNYSTTAHFAVSEDRGVASTFGFPASNPSFFFYDSNVAVVAAAHSKVRATFTSGSANFTVSNYIAETFQYAVPSGAPIDTPPMMKGLLLFDTSNNNNSVIPANAYLTALPATPYTTSGTFTMSAPAASSGTIDVTLGGCYPGVPIVPPPTYNVRYARYTQPITVFGAAVPANGFDDLDLFPFAFGNASHIKATGAGTNLLRQSSPHQYGFGWQDVEASRPWRARWIGVIGDSLCEDWMWSKTFELITRCDLRLRAGVSGRQPHQFLDGCATGTSVENWNYVTANSTGALTNADIVGIEALLIGPPSNAWGYTSTGAGRNTTGDHRQPYPIGALADTAPVAVFQVTATAGGAIITVSGLESGVIRPGATFPTGSPGNLAGKVIQAYGTSSTTGTGGNGTYALNNGTGVTLISSAAWATVGTLYGTMNWLLTTLQGWNTTNTGNLLPFLCTPLRRYDGGSGNGGETDPTNPGNPVNTIGVRLADIADAITAIGRKWGVPVIDLYSDSMFTPFSTGKLYLADKLHPKNFADFPDGSRAFGTVLANGVNRLGVPI